MASVKRRMKVDDGEESQLDGPCLHANANRNRYDVDPISLYVSRLCHNMMQCFLDILATVFHFNLM